MAMERQKKLVIILAVTAAALAIVAAVLIITTFYHRSDSGNDNPTDSATVTEAPTDVPTEAVTDETTAPVTIPATDPPQIHQTTPEPPAPQTSSAENGVFFTPVNEQVTAKREVNLRSTMEQGGNENIVCTLNNGDTALRTGVGDNGWSRLEYGGRTLYCVSSYITTDLSYVPPAEETDQFRTKFTPVNEKVTAKELTNLRDRPSVVEPSKVIYELRHGDIAIRTGIAGEGWSRVEFGGQVLYCVSSYLEIVEE